MWYNWNEIFYLKNLNVKWKLKSLTLNYCIKNEDRCILWSELFDILSDKFGENMKDLTLGLPEIIDEEDTSKLVDKMLTYQPFPHNLKTLNLDVKNYAPFDFLLGLFES